MADARPRKRSVVVSGHRTSVSLEQGFWRVLTDVARRRGLSVGALITEIDQGRDGNLSSAIRIYLLEWLESGGVADGDPPSKAC